MPAETQSWSTPNSDTGSCRSPHFRLCRNWLYPTGNNDHHSRISDRWSLSQLATTDGRCHRDLWAARNSSRHGSRAERSHRKLDPSLWKWESLRPDRALFRLGRELFLGTRGRKPSWNWTCRCRCSVRSIA